MATYTVVREDGAQVRLEFDPADPAGFTVTVPGEPGVVTEVYARDLLARAFAQVADARAALAAGKAKLAEKGA